MATDLNRNAHGCSVDGFGCGLWERQPLYSESLGASIGRSIYQISMILTANISGWIAGEWKGAGLQSKYMLWGGLFLLGRATLAITYGNH
jgi:hypothetical protein